MKIYTKRGDTGQTDLFGGQRVSKAHPRVSAYGLIDTANSTIGFAAVLPSELQPRLHQIMSELFDLGAELASTQKCSQDTAFLKSNHITQLENWIDEADQTLPPLKNFVLPTGCELSARLHLARTAVRQAEQETVALLEHHEPVRPEIIQYLNRLSDLLFTWARWANIQNNTDEVLWVKS